MLDSSKYTDTKTVSMIVDAIKKDEWNNILKDIDLLNFVKKQPDGSFDVDETKRIQTRGFQINRTFVDEKVAYVRNTGDYSGLMNLTVLFFNAEYMHSSGRKFESNSYYLVDRNHGTLIKVNLDIFTSDAYVVDFWKHLNGKWSNVRALTNGLNYEPKSQLGADEDDIKNEYLDLIEENIEAGFDPKPTVSQNNSFIERYPTLTKTALGNWWSHNQLGGRSTNAIRNYSDRELKEFKASYEAMDCYSDHIVMKPMAISTMKGMNIASVFNAVYEHEKKNGPMESRKVLLPVYASTNTQGDIMDSGKFDDSKYDKGGPVFKDKMMKIAEIDVFIMKLKTRVN